MFPGMKFVCLVALFTSSTAEAADQLRLIDHWVHRTEAKLAAARQSGRLSEDQLAHMNMAVAILRAKRDEAAEDNIVTIREREELRRLDGQLEMEIAEARFGPQEEKPAVLAENQPRNIRPRGGTHAEPGMQAIIPAR